MYPKIWRIDKINMNQIKIFHRLNTKAFNKKIALIHLLVELITTLLHWLHRTSGDDEKTRLPPTQKNS